MLWIGACINKLDAIKTAKYTDEEKGLMQAFKGADNAQKHAAELFEFSEYISESCWPISFSMRFGEGNYVFKELDVNIIDRKNQIKKYNELLKAKDIIESVNLIRNIIIKQMENDDIES